MVMVLTLPVTAVLLLISMHLFMRERGKTLSLEKANFMVRANKEESLWIHHLHSSVVPI